ncbi:YheC/YheD family protein [Paenibacillus sp. HB172176]|uniref:YheC/YheD family protein n=1 Tax=Paenibacillus sp. HB172176 TaxID=2493690 RepID=UPI00143BCF6F|nr:YheC/YheD family protein [Paenibacillus sp. HB172176]
MKPSWNKWSKYTIMKKSSSLIPSLPQTLPLSARTLATMIDRYKTVIVKPRAKSGGAGVFRITKQSPRQLHVRWEKHSRKVSDISAVMSLLNRHSLGSGLVQRYVNLATVGSRPFDARVMVQRGRSRSWKVTGSLAKIAGPGYLVTNTARSRGYVLPLPEAIRKSPSLMNQSGSIVSQSHALSLRTARHLHAYYPWIRTVGMDVGIDRKGKPWIIEANFSPSRSLFKRLKDKSMYRRIIKWG